jgi:heme exporter protein CcmD
MTALHTTFITAAYCFAGFVLCVLLIWVMLDYRAQKKQLTDLEAQRAKKK